MTVSYYRGEGQQSVHVSGTVDSSAVEEFNRVVDCICYDQPRQLEVDLSAVTSMPWPELTTLLRQLRRARMVVPQILLRPPETRH